MEENPDKYISLQEATEYCNYSQEYLSLRARQGKLKSVKFGRNWVTKKEWLEEYLKKVEEYNNFKVKKVLPPENLPVEPLPGFQLQEFFRISQPRFALITVLVFVLLIAGIFYGKENFRIVAYAISNISQSFVTFSQVAEVGKGSGEILKDYLSWLRDSLKSISQKIVKGYFVANDFLERKFSQAYKAISQIFKKPEKIVEELLPKPTEEGLVVIPSTEKDEETIRKIKEAFSDEVKVEPKDKTSGIIIPVFREREGEKYLYILVPVKN